MAHRHRDCWCGGRSARAVANVRVPGSRSRHELVRCKGCGVFALHPPPTDEELFAAYDTDYYGASPRKFVGPVAALVGLFQGGRARLVARYAQPGTRLLDVGCGNGGFLAQLQEKGYQVEGTEWTQASASRVVAGIPVHVGELTTLGLEAGAYDAVSLWHVFEHLRAPDAALREIHRLLRPGGVLFLSMPNQESRQARLFGADWFHLDPPRHLHGFGPKSLGSLLRAEGFQITRLHTWSMEQNPYGWLQSVLNKRGFPRDRAYNVLKGTIKTDIKTRLGDLFRLGLLAGPAVVVSSLESLAGVGATMTLVAQREPSP